MKNIFGLFFVLLLTLLNCKKEDSSAVKIAESSKAEEVMVNLLSTDSVQVADSVKLDENLTAAFKSAVLVFPNLTNKTLLDSIYLPVNIKLKEYSKENISMELNAQKKQYYDDTKKALEDWKPDFAQTWEQNSDMKLFSELRDFITIKYTSDGYTGGAHGYYNELYRVFDLKTNKNIQLADLLKVKDAKIWSRILMDHFLKNDLGKGQAEMLLVKEITLTENFYFDQEHLYFHYNQYEITAYAAGPVVIKIPLSEIKPFLNQDFRTKLNLN